MFEIINLIVLFTTMINNNKYDNMKTDQKLIFKNPPARKKINNGYIQMYHELKSNGYKKLKFKIPNKEVYNNNVSKIMSEFHNQNIFLQFLKDFVNYNVKV